MRFIPSSPFVVCVGAIEYMCIKCYSDKSLDNNNEYRAIENIIG